VPPRTAAGRTRRPGGAGRNAGTIATVVGSLLVIIVALVVIFTVVLGGDDNPKVKPLPNTVAPAASSTTPAASATNGSGASTGAKVNRSQVTVAVLNGTTFTGLARGASDKLTKAGFAQGVVTNDTTNQTRSATAVFYADGQRNAALEVAKIVGIARDAVRRIDANTRRVAGEDAEVVVSVGADQAR
jgi:predicted metalloprotease